MDPINVVAIAFDQPDLINVLAKLDDKQIDELPFGVIGFGRDCLVKRYNRFESEATGLLQEKVLRKHVFTDVAQCMNNFLVAQRYEDAWTSASPLDATLDYVLTWRMNPVKVKLRLLWAINSDLAFIALTPRTALPR
jgi:photoactive yellow protein